MSSGQERRTEACQAEGQFSSPASSAEAAQMHEDRKRLSIVIGCCVAIFWPGAMNFGFPGVMAPLWQEMFHIGRGAAGSILFFMLAAVGIFMFLVGRWQERYGTRAMIAIGVFSCGLNAIIAGYATSIFWIYVWAFFNGASSCFVYIPALTVVQRWYPLKRGLVSGVVSLVFGMSAAVMSPFFGQMQSHMGYLNMTISIAVLSIAAGIVALYILKDPDAVPVAMQSQRSMLSGTEAARADADIAAYLDKFKKSMTVSESLHTRSFWLLWIIWAMQGAAGVAMITLSTSYGLSKGMALESAVLILTAFNTTNGAGRVISGYLSDILGRNVTMSIAFFGAGAAYFLFPHVSSLAACSVLAALVGLSFGTLFSVSAPLVSDCFGLKHFGAIFGLVFTAYGLIAGLLGPSLSGYLLDMTGGNFFLVFLYLGVLCMISGLSIRLVVPPHHPNN